MLLWKSGLVACREGRASALSHSRIRYPGRCPGLVWGAPWRFFWGERGSVGYGAYEFVAAAWFAL